MVRPRSSRPHMPGYGVLGQAEGGGLLPWSFATERLEASHNYWLATVRPDGRPHAMAVWGLWTEDAFFFSTGGESRKARNLAASPHCVVTTEGAAEAVVVEGRAELVRNRRTLASIAARYEAKYAEGYPPDSNVYRVRPERVFAFIEAAERFAGAATRWTFAD